MRSLCVALVVGFFFLGTLASLHEVVLPVVNVMPVPEYVVSTYAPRLPRDMPQVSTQLLLGDHVTLLPCDVAGWSLAVALGQHTVLNQRLDTLVGFVPSLALQEAAVVSHKNGAIARLVVDVFQAPVVDAGIVQRLLFGTLVSATQDATHPGWLNIVCGGGVKGFVPTESVQFFQSPDCSTPLQVRKNSSL